MRAFLGYRGVVDHQHGTGEAEDKMLMQRIIAGDWPELANACRLGLTLQPQPEWNMPPDGALRARCLNGAKFYIKLTSPADSVWKGGTVFSSYTTRPALVSDSRSRL